MSPDAKVTMHVVNVYKVSEAPCITCINRHFPENLYVLEWQRMQGNELGPYWICLQRAPYQANCNLGSING